MSALTSPSPSPSPTAGWTEDALPARVARLRRWALVVGVAGLAVWVVLALLFTGAALPAYLVAYTTILGLSVGSLGFLLLHFLVSGKWGFVIRRPLEAATMVLPVMVVLFLPIVLGMRWLYVWVDPHGPGGSEELVEAIRQKAGYLNVTFWLVRAAIYFAVWIGLSLLIRRNSMAQDATEDPAPTRRSQAFSGPGLVAVFLAVTFAAIDWMMSIEPLWYSSIYGVMVMIGWALTALSLVVLVSSWLSDVHPLSDLADAGGFQDLGNLMLAFTMLWAYMSFSQYLIIWMGNLTEEIPWYLKRSVGGWRYVAGGLMVFHFFLPFFCLLARENKRMPTRLWRIAVLILAVHLVNDVWLIVPVFPKQGLQLLALVPATAGVGGVWLWAFTGRLASRPLLPRHDPLLADVLAHHGGGH